MIFFGSALGISSWGGLDLAPMIPEGLHTSYQMAWR